MSTGRALVVRLLPVLLSTGLATGALAEGAARPDGAAASGSGPCAVLWSGEEESFSLGLAPADGSLAGAARDGGRPLLRRFSLCPPLAAPDAPGAPGSLLSRPSLRTGAAAAADPRAPLRGVRNANAPFGTKFGRGVLIITGTEIASGLLLSLMPKENTNWDGNPLSRAGSNFRRAYTSPPVWDGDVYFHNWIGHPYAGAFYYNMIRSQGGTIGESFAFAVFQSTMWEYVLESWAEQPSIQDLIATPLIGAVVGELFHRWSLAIIRKGKLNFGQKALVFFLNPSYVINNGYRPPE